MYMLRIVSTDIILCSVTTFIIIIVSTWSLCWSALCAALCAGLIGGAALGYGMSRMGGGLMGWGMRGSWSSLSSFGSCGSFGSFGSFWDCGNVFFIFLGGLMVVVVVCFSLFCDVSVCFCFVFSKIAFFSFFYKNKLLAVSEISGAFFVVVFCLSACTSDHLLWRVISVLT